MRCLLVRLLKLKPIKRPTNLLLRLTLTPTIFLAKS
jgi:hypothetical protein